MLCNNNYKWLFLIGAGTGIAPLYQLAKFVIDNEEDERRICLFYGCKNYEEVLLRPELQRMQGYWNFGVKYFLSRDDDVRVGQVKKHNEVVTCSWMTQEDLREKLSVMSTNKGSVGIFVCGPKDFEKSVKNWLPDGDVMTFWLNKLKLNFLNLLTKIRSKVEILAKKINVDWI